VLVVAEVSVRPERLWRGAVSSAVPFLTLAGVIAAAALADRAGVFRRIAQALVPDSASAARAVWAVLLLTALLSGLVNLDVAVVVAVPVALRVSRRTGVSAGWLAAAVAITANATSFLFPTSNVTTLLVLSSSAAGLAGYLSQSWGPWILVTSLTLVVLSVVVARRRADEVRAIPDGGIRVGAVADLVPLFLIAAAVRGLLLGGVPLHGSFPEQVAVGSALAAGVNNLPAAAAVRATGATSAWAAILAMAIGPNLLITGSVATLICRRIARDGGTQLRAGRFMLLGGVLVPLQLCAAAIGLRLTGVLR
jgi:Na+/H+ antiporter NhaD/arsenite permease-like protein